MLQWPQGTLHRRSDVGEECSTLLAIEVQSPETMFLHRRSGFIKEPLESAPLYKDLKSRCVTEETYTNPISSRAGSLHRLSNVGEETYVSSVTYVRSR